MTAKVRGALRGVRGATITVRVVTVDAAGRRFVETVDLRLRLRA
jgi:hypothetical protein